MNVRSLQNYSEVGCCQVAKSEAQLGFGGSGHLRGWPQRLTPFGQASV
jgi:hypothetical protein